MPLHDGTASEEETQALPWLRADHAQLVALFGDYRRLSDSQGSAADISALINRIAVRIKAIVAIEREFILPLLEEDGAVREARDRLDDLLVLLDQLAVKAPAGKGLDEPMGVLARAFLSHIRHEEIHLLPRLEGRDLAETGAALRHRRAELLMDEAPD